MKERNEDLTDNAARRSHRDQRRHRHVYVWLVVCMALLCVIGGRRGSDASVSGNVVRTEISGLGTVVARAALFDDRLAPGDVWIEAATPLHLWFECLLVSTRGAVQVCTVTRGVSGVYGIESADVPQTGIYRIALTLAHTGEAAADPSEIPSGTQFEGTQYALQHAVSLRRTVSDCTPYYTVPPPWARRQEISEAVAGGVLEMACPAGSIPELPGAAERLHLILVGDSHMRGWRDTLRLADGSYNASGNPLDGIAGPAVSPSVTYLRVEGMEFTDKVPSSKIPEELQGGSAHTDAQLQHLQGVLGKVRSGADAYRGKAVAVAMNFGAWDLRDVRLDVYCERVKRLAAKIEALGLQRDNPSVRFIWRATTAYSYMGKNYRSSDLRTNEKIAMANACARRHLSHGRWEFHDSFAFTHPLFYAPCDSHHYLCPVYPGRVATTPVPCRIESQGTVIAEGCAGKADFLEFLRLMSG
eukprot:TRINITY_DN14408_c0_g1_i1.p1 TRINITY_DN14408_c0_g1~~TRINITY_DN14408_c0_g1_i1.p1  ORF type:complete len:471 (+),score=98.00 TRINITY_DN14408_c0_g1_i1:92-1504(+)